MECWWWKGGRVDCFVDATDEGGGCGFKGGCGGEEGG